MTDIDLGNFEGKEVLATSVAVTNAGDGLSEALAVDPQILHQGDRGAILLEYEVAKVRFDPVKDTHGLTRVHILKAKTGTLLDLDEVQERLDAQRIRIEEAEGTLQLPFDGDDEGPRGGEPQTAGQVLDDALDLAADAEGDTEWREQRTSQLDGMNKPELKELALRAGVAGASGLTKVELVDAIVDAELAGGA